MCFLAAVFMTMECIYNVAWPVMFDVLCTHFVDCLFLLVFNLFYGLICLPPVVVDWF